MSFKIKDICDINKESLSKKDDIKYINYLDTSNLTLGTIDEIQKLTVGEDKIPSRAKRKVKIDDILISTVRPNQKHYGILKKVDDNMIASTGFAILTPNKKIVNPSYLYNYLTQNEITEYLQGVAETSTTAYPSIKPSDIGYLEIELPPIEEQKAIAKILSDLDNKIEVNNKINKRLEDMAQSIFKHWFVDFEFPNEEGKGYKSSGGEMVESELGMIPKGWEVKNISDICEIGSSKRIFMKEYVDNGIPFYRGKEIILKSKGDIISSELFIPEERYKEIKEKFGAPIKNDILLTSVGTLGVAYLVGNEEFYFKDGNLTWFKNFIKDDYRYYIYQFLISNEGKKELDAITIGSTQKALTINSLNNIRIGTPSSELLNRFKNLIISIIDSVRRNNIENERLTNLRDTLLPKLMSGEIRVPTK